MTPTYLNENRYSFVIDAARELAQASFEIDSPETAFERNVQRRLVEANQLLLAGRHSAALQEYRSLRGVIASVLYPRIPPFVGIKLDWLRLAKLGIADTVIGKSAQMLDRTPSMSKAIPSSLLTAAPMSAEMSQVFAEVETAGLTDADEGVRGPLADLQSALAAGNFEAAAKSAAAAAGQAKDAELAGALLHDQAVLQERSGQRAPALEAMQASIKAFNAAGKHEAQLAAMTTLAAMQTRGDDAEGAKRTLAQAEEVRKKFSVFPIRPPVETVFDDRIAVNRRIELRQPSSRIDVATRPGGTIGTGDRLGASRAARISDTAGVGAAADASEVALMSFDAFQARRSDKTITVFDESRSAVPINVAGGATAGLTDFYTRLRDSTDLSLLTGYLGHHTTTITYLAHIIGWVLPMAIGDCQVALGAYADAETEYRSTLDYKYLNVAVESVTLWLRLADLYLEWGDRLYRDAANVVANFAAAKAKYELVLKLDDTLDEASPLHAAPAFAGMKARSLAIVKTVFVDGLPNADNPRVTMALARARMQLHKIANGLNYLGMSLHVPPFSFEHLQNLARYFAQHAAQVEQSYIQFKSSGENETLREQQMAQQASIAHASVELERRGQAEAQEGVDVASAGLNYANVQQTNAQQMKTRFDNVRWELQELDRLQAWAGSASNDEVKLNVKNASFYSADSKPRSHVLFDLANRRAQISHDIEAARMQDEIEAAAAYGAMAQQQVQQAQARVAVAQQRVLIAGLQAQYASENLAFLTGREFSSTMWYDLAREARRITRRYLDMAIEVAVLMEKAYEAETGRDLRKIKLDYGLEQTGGLLGADALLLDIDFFSLDFVRTKSKKAPMKQSLSLADHFPMAFDQLLRTGHTLFETTLAHFDRRYPGFYLQKIKQVELLFVGLAGTEGVHGTLRNIGLSKFRRADGSIVDQVYPADVMPLTDYDVRQDAIVFQLSSNELRLFENNGIATVWQLDVPLHSNTFELSQILDVQLLLYYDGFFSPGLEQMTIAALPAAGSGTRSFSLRLTAPDELFFLRNQGNAALVLDARLLPSNQGDPQLKSYFLQARGAAAAGLNLRVDWAGLAAGHLFTLDAAGNADGAAFTAPVNRTLLDTLAFSVSAADNPQLVKDGALDLSGLLDLSLFVDYAYTYRVAA
jgi:Tc toxin complex TcA C-terminal TcB-binding domain